LTKSFKHLVVMLLTQWQYLLAAYIVMPYANSFKVVMHFWMVERFKCTHTSFELHKIRIMNINNIHDCTKKSLFHPISLAKQLRIIDWWWRKVIFQDSHVPLISLLIKITLPSCQRNTMPTSRCNLYLC
jgi:hypothetical protein